MFICYVRLGEETVPLVCEEIEQSALLDTHIVLKRTKMIEDNFLPILDIKEMCISKEQIEYYVSGTLKQESEGLFEALEFSRERKKQEIKEKKKLKNL